MDGARPRGISVFGVLIVMCAMAVPAASSRADIVGTTAETVVSVQELVAGNSASFADDSDTFPNPGTPIQLDAFAEVRSTDLLGALEASGQAFGRFTPPSGPVTDNPEELSLEAACYSNSNRVSYIVRSSVSELRTIRLSSGEISPREDGLATVQGRFFLTGAIVLWSTGAPDHGETKAEVSVVVTDPASDDPLLNVTVVVRVSGDDVELSSDGDIETRLVTLSELAQLGADAESLQTLQKIDTAGRLAVVVIPSQSIPYSFEMQPNESTGLQAEIDLVLRNAPGRTGVAATLGRPFSELTGFIESALDVDGQSIQRAVNKAISQSPDQAVPPPLSPCGALGPESLAALALLTSLAIGPVRRRRMNRR